MALSYISWVDSKSDCNSLEYRDKVNIFPQTSVYLRNAGRKALTTNKIKACVWDAYGHLVTKTVSNCKK